MCGIWCTLMRCLFRSGKVSGSTGEKKSKPKLTRNQEIFIFLWNFDALRAVLLTVLNIIVIVLVWTSKSSIQQYRDTVRNAQISVNKLGMQLSSTAGDDDKTAATILVVIESLTIVFNLMHIMLLFWMLNDRTIASWKIKALFSTIGSMHSGLLIARVICVDRLRPPDFSELNKTTLLKSLHDGYKDDSFPSPGNADSDTWNKIFIDFQCCAVNPVTSTTNDFDLTPWCTTSGSCQQTNSQIPKACCKGVDITTYTSAPSECHEHVNSGYYNKKGCAVVWSDAVKNYKNEKQTVFLSGLVAAISHAVSLIFSLCLVLALLITNNIQVRQNEVESTEEGARKGMDIAEDGGGT